MIFKTGYILNSTNTSQFSEYIRFYFTYFNMVNKIAILIFSLFVIISCSKIHDATDKVISERDGNFYYIDNGTIRLGVDLERGGSIFYFAESVTKRNVLNHADEGRFIQQSYYGEPDSSIWVNQPWVWNPIQGGGCHGEKARILKQTFDETGINIVSEPVHWASGMAISDAEMEEIITMKGRMAHIHYIFRNTGRNATNHPATHQELPAVFVDANLPNLIYYGGSSPWTGDSLKSVVPGWPNEEHIRTEEWAAYVDSTQWGIGVYTPGTSVSTAYRFSGDGTAGPEGSACSYFAPVRTFAITKDLIFEYDVYLYIGTISEIRKTFEGIYRHSRP